MAAEYILTATSWRDAQGVRHYRGDVVSPPEAEVDRLLRARALTTLEAAAEAAEADVARAREEAQRKLEGLDRELSETAGQPNAAAALEAEAAADAKAADSGTLDGVVPPVIVPGGKPKKVAPVKEWEDHAVALYEASGGKEGLTRAEAEAWTKLDLIAKFG